jgi:mono/diheme cytochrome c family protein
MRAAPAIATALAAGGLAMTIAAFASSDDEAPARTRPGAATAPRAAAAAPGAQVWVANGCGSCHAFAPAGAKGTLAPDLTETLRGSSRTFIRRSITDPDAEDRTGWGTGMMPPDYADRMSGAELDALVDFLLEGSRPGD